jgi:RNA polymerase sigma-70 factor (ECF subfamily)
MQNIQNAPGTRQQFELLFQRSQRRVYRFAYHLLGNTCDAEDVVQDAYLRAWQHFDGFDTTRSFEGWLFRIVTNRVIDLRRRQKRVPMYSLDTAFYFREDEPFQVDKFAAPHSDPAEIVIEPILEETLQNALEALPTNYRTAILLCDVEQYSYQDIANMMQCAIGTVRSRIHRARVLLRDHIKSAPTAG